MRRVAALILLLGACSAKPVALPRTEIPLRNPTAQVASQADAALSRLAGVSLKCLGFPTSDPTNNFKLYDGEWLRKQKIESTGGFEVALELCHKAFLQGERIAELPTEWRDRTSGESHFRLLAWLPAYLRWYLLTLRALLSGTRARTSGRDD